MKMHLYWSKNIFIDLYVNVHVHIIYIVYEYKIEFIFVMKALYVLKGIHATLIRGL